MIRRPQLRYFALLFFAGIEGCSRHTPAPSPSVDSLSPLVAAVAVDRAMLDSVVAQIHALSGDSSATSLARFDRLRSRADTLDARYREDVVALFTTITARAAAVSETAPRLPVDKSRDPFVRAFADGANWMLQSPMIYQVGPIRTNVIIVPRGFITDFASVPQPLRAIRDLMPSSSRYGIPALVHDYLYWRQDCTREQADAIMELALKKSGVGLLERKVVHEGLRQLGQSAWDGNTRARESRLIRTVGPPNDQIPLTATWPEYRSWLNSVGAKPGVEYSVPRSVCRAADSSD